jgi:hypothetical protein
MWISIAAILTKILLSFCYVDINVYCGNALKTAHDNFLSIDFHLILHNDEITVSLFFHIQSTLIEQIVVQ